MWLYSSNTMLMTGNPKLSRRMTRNVIPIAARVTLNCAEQAMPTESDMNSAANSTPTIRPTSAGSTPPISSGTIITGATAIRPNTACNEQALILPSTTSSPRRFVRNSSPSVPLRFSSLSVSAVSLTPARLQKKKAKPAITPKMIWLN